MAMRYTLAGHLDGLTPAFFAIRTYSACIYGQAFKVFIFNYYKVIIHWIFFTSAPAYPLEHF